MTETILLVMTETLLVRLVVLGLISAGGLVIGWQGYRGFRRNDNQTLLWLSIGILLLTTVPIGGAGLLRITDVVTQQSVNLIVLMLINSGLIVILYAFTRG